MRGYVMQKSISFHFFIYVCLLVIISTITSVMPLQAYEYEDKSIVPKNIGYPIDSGFIIGEFNNKLRYFMRENDNPKDTVIVKLIVEAGSAYEEENEQGLAHFLEHMAFNGTKNFPGTTAIDFMREKGIGEGGHYNASTGFYTTSYDLELPSPSEDPETFRTGLQIIRDWLFYITFDSAEIEKERGVVLSELRVRRGFNQDVSDLLVSNIYKDTVLSQRLPIGKEEHIEAFTKKDFEKFYKRWYHPQNAALVVVGDIDLDVYFPIIKQMFSVTVEEEFLPPSPSLFEVPRFSRKDMADIFTMHSEQATDSELIIAFKLPPIPVTSSIKDIEKTLLFFLLYQCVNERLTELTQEENSPVLSAYMSDFDFNLNNKAAPVVLFYAYIDAERKEEGISAFTEALVKIYDYGFSEDEIQSAKDILISQFYLDADSEDSGSFEFVFGVEAAVVSKNFLYIADDEWLSDSVSDLLEPFKKEHVQYVVSQIFESEDRVVLFSEKEEDIEADTIREIFFEGITAQYTPPEEKQRQTSLQFSPVLQIESNEDAIVKEHYYQELDMYKWELKNGITVYSKDTDIEDSSIYFSAEKIIDRFSDLEDAKIALSSRDIAGNSGLANFDATEFRRYSDTLQLSISHSVYSDKLKIDGFSKTFDFEEGMKILYESLVYPKFDKKAIRIWQNEVNNALKQEQDPYSVFSDRINRIVNSYDPRYERIKASTVNSVTQEKLLSLNKEMYGSFKNWKFFFVGNLDKVDFKDTIVKYIANLPYDTNEIEHKVQPTGLSLEGFRDIELEFESIEESSTVAQLIVPMDNDMLLFDKKVLARALGLLIDVRTNDLIREDLGLSYSPYAGTYYSEDDDTLVLYVRVSHEKENRQRIEQAIFNIIQDISVGNISLSELQNIKKAIIEERYSLLDSNKLMISYLSYALSKRDADQYVKDYVYPGYILDILIEDITVDKIADFAKYISEEAQGLIIATLSPSED